MDIDAKIKVNIVNCTLKFQKKTSWNVESHREHIQEGKCDNVYCDEIVLRYRSWGESIQ